MQGQQPYYPNPQYRQQPSQPYFNNGNINQGFTNPNQPQNFQNQPYKNKKPKAKFSFNKLLIGFLGLLIVTLGAGCVYLYTETQRLNKKVADTQTEIIARANTQIISQKKQKNEIADIFDDQAALNDDLIDSQRDVTKSSQDFMTFISNSIRFIGGKPQFLSEFSEEELVDKKNEVLQEINELDKLSQENANKKETNSDRVNQIYLEAGEDRNNTANEREGFR